MGSRILIVDDDPWIRRMVSTMLQRQGHVVETAENGAAGIEAVDSFRPVLIITDVLMDHMDGWAFVRRLRANPNTSMIPVIFLTALSSDQDRIRGFRLGADDYLSKPFRFEELGLRVERTLRSLERTHSAADEVRSHQDKRADLTGDLTQLGVSILLTIMEMERKSGLIVLESSEHMGRIFVRDGRVVSATCDGFSDEAAVYEMLSWESGTFQFRAIDVEMEDTVQSTTTHLLMEGARRMDEADLDVSFDDDSVL